MSKKLILFIFIACLLGLALHFIFMRSVSQSIDEATIAHAFDIAVEANPESEDKTVHTRYFVDSPLEWEELAEGLDYTYRRETLTLALSPEEQSTSTFSVYFVRIDPSLYDFSLHGAFLEKDNTYFTLPEWSAKNDLILAMNASMYLPDNLTSTGHMRTQAKVNNGRIAQNMGGFFLSGRRNTSTFPAILLEKSDTEWQSILNNYDTAVQNFRILGSNTGEKSTKTLWHYTNAKHAIAAYGQDISGDIYFIFSQNPTTVYELGQYLLALAHVGLDFKTVLYAEGGREAALYLKTEKKQLHLTGLNSNFLTFASPLPNIMGVKKR